MSERKVGQIEPLHHTKHKLQEVEDGYALAIFERIVGPKIWEHYAKKQRERNPQGFEQYWAQVPYTLSVLRVIPTPDGHYPTRAYDPETDDYGDSILVVGLGQHVEGNSDGSNSHGISVPYRVDEIEELTSTDKVVINHVWEICQRAAPWDQKD